jgi:hypothetical protein
MQLKRMSVLRSPSSAIKPHVAGLCLLILLFAAGCNTPPVGPTAQPTATDGPTTIPATATRTITASPLPEFTFAPTPTFRALVTATVGNTPTPPPAPIAAQPTQKESCTKALKNDTIGAILTRLSFDYSALDTFRDRNNIPPGSNIVIEGSTYCMPPRTLTPTPIGYEKTQTALAPILGPKGAQVYIQYKVKEGDTTLALEFKFGIPLGTICSLNQPPDGLNCNGCNLNAGIGQAGCRVLLRVGQVLNLPGPTPTPTITPTLTGSETATATPSYAAPRLLAPENSATVSGVVRLRWLPAGGILNANERYVVLLTEKITDTQYRNSQFFTDSTSLLIPLEAMPQGSGSHEMLWQVAITRIEEDGTAVQISPRSATATFIWTP